MDLLLSLTLFLLLLSFVIIAEMGDPSCLGELESWHKTFLEFCYFLFIELFQGFFLSLEREENQARGRERRRKGRRKEREETREAERGKER